jgi:hypothetical protein
MSRCRGLAREGVSGQRIGVQRVANACEVIATFVEQVRGGSLTRATRPRRR